MTLAHVLTAFVYLLAVARVTGFLTTDRLLENVRYTLIRRWCGSDPEVDCKSGWPYLLTCPWCMSIWVAPPAAIIWFYWPTSPWFLIPAMWLAFSQLTGMMSGIGR
jgi:hypothetical protein